MGQSPELRDVVPLLNSATEPPSVRSFMIRAHERGVDGALSGGALTGLRELNFHLCFLGILHAHRPARYRETRSKTTPRSLMPDRPGCRLDPRKAEITLGAFPVTASDSMHCIGPI